MKKIFLLFVIALISHTLNAQKKLDKAAKQADAAVDIIGGIGSLFKKKDKKNKGEEGVTNGTTSEAFATSEESNIKGKADGTLFGKKVIIGGKITDKTLMIDCDEMNPFNKGAALIEKGDSYALIDSSGKFIVPFNKYKLINETNQGNGIFLCKNQDNYYVYINSEGKLLTKALSSSLQISKDGRHLISYTNNTRSYELIDYYGSSITINLNESDYYNTKEFGDGVFVVEKNYSNDEYLRDIKTGKNIYTTAYNDINVIGNGTALCSFTDQFNITKYRVLFYKEKKYLETIFNAQPTATNYGFFIAKGSATADFEYALFNNRAEIILKQFKNDKSNNISISSLNFEDGFARCNYSNNIYVDTTGKLYTERELFKAMGMNLPADNYSISPEFNNSYYTYSKWENQKFEDGYLQFKVRHYNSNVNGTIMYNKRNGDMLFIHTNGHGINDAFDPVSKLILVKKYTGKNDINGREIFYEGFMNQKGEYVMIKGKPKSDF